MADCTLKIHSSLQYSTYGQSFQNPTQMQWTKSAWKPEYAEDFLICSMLILASKAVDSHRGFHLFQGIRQTPQQNPQVTHVDLAMDSLWICHGIMAKFSGGNSPPCLDLPKRRILNSVHKQIKNMKILSVHTQKNKKTKY